VSTDYFEVMRIPLKRGRLFTCRCEIASRSSPIRPEVHGDIVDSLALRGEDRPFGADQAAVSLVTWSRFRLRSACHRSY
jgi:hypothetical protein